MFAARTCAIPHDVERGVVFVAVKDGHVTLRWRDIHRYVRSGEAGKTSIGHSEQREEVRVCVRKVESREQ
mgnify:CR=1 FL=1